MLPKAFFLIVLVGPSILVAEDFTYRIRLGLTDETPTTWDGSLKVSGGEVASLRSWRPTAADEINATSWKLATTPGRKFRFRNWEPEPSTPVPDYVYIPGLILTVSAKRDAKVQISTAQGDFEFRLSDQTPARRRSYLGGSVVVERAAGLASVSGGDHEAGFADVLAEDDGAYWVAWVGYSDWTNRVFVRRFNGSAWEAPQDLTGEADIYYVRLARDNAGRIHAVWSNQTDANFDLWTRRLDDSGWSQAERLTSAPQPDIHQALATDANGNVWLAWQGFRDGHSDIFSRRWDGQSWSAPERVSTSADDDWNPALAADSKGNVYLAWDTYDKNDYDILMRRFNGSNWEAPVPVADTPRYEAYPSLVCDHQDRLWAAWNESDMQWGKDTGLLVRRPAVQLYQSRTVEVAVYESGQWRQPPSFEDSLPSELQRLNDYPELETDGDGRVWALFRHRFLRQREVPYTAAAHRAAWETYATAFDGKTWTTPIPLAATQGRSDAGFGLARSPAGDLYAAWATDNRIYDDYYFEHGEVFASRLPTLSGPVWEPSLSTKTRDELTIFAGHPNEAADLAQIRGYEISSAGKTYKIYRGDTHRHTEYSGDGNNDGSLNDTYRYSMNAAELDFLGLSDHHGSGGPNIEYINWLLQQRVDVFTVPGRFVPLYGYERGAGYPNGHRNIMFAERGNPTFRDQPNERETSTGAVGLFDYLRKYNGISIPHTSATNMGTDWRDSAPDVEPLVEIYQGDRISSEYHGAPKSASADDPTSHAGGFRPAGYVWNAWAKGYKIGIQASSDHLSTHISYACTIAEDHTRSGLLDAMRKRHSYGATDNIVLDYRMRVDGAEYLQGDIIEPTAGKAQLWVKVLGTAPIRQIDIIRGQEFVHTVQNLGPQTEFTFVDNDAPAGETYYYVRVQQANEQMAWSSPIWITRP